MEDHQTGKIIKSTGSWYHVLAEDGSIHRARLRGKFKQNKINKTNPIAVGDYVSFAANTDQENNGLIVDIHERKNYIERKSTHKGGHHGHILSSNLDLAILVVTIMQPRTSTGFVDRFLVACESSEVTPVLVFNKLDLIEGRPQAEELYFDFLSIYRELGYQTFGLSAKEEKGLEDLVAAIEGKTVLFAGHSGVGKSTLLNKLIPKANQQVDEISEYANKGKHTTTFAELFFGPGGSQIIDTPGIKELGIINLDHQNLDFFFVEFRKYAENCEFYDCTHTHEPKCAVIRAVTDEEIHESRYNSYLGILQDEDSHR